MVMNEKEQKQLRNIVKTIICGAILTATSQFSYKTGQGVERNKIMRLENAKEVKHPYRGFNPKADISKENAEQYLLDMHRGDQIRYKGAVITLLKRYNDMESSNTGVTDYFVVSNSGALKSGVVEKNTSNLNAKTIDQVFGK